MEHINYIADVIRTLEHDIRAEVIINNLQQNKDITEEQYVIRKEGHEVWFELGLQQAFDGTLVKVNRGHTASRNILLAPKWCAEKWNVVNSIEQELHYRASHQDICAGMPFIRKDQHDA